MHKLLIATTNEGKIRELRDFLSDLPIKLVSLRDVSITDDVEEDGTTYQENAEKKALFYAKVSNLPAIADDSGLEITALEGAPGLKSRRWVGEHASDEDIIKKMMELSRTLPDDNRQAFFKSVVTLALPNGKVWSVPGQIEGVIAKKPLMKLLAGYPYRSFFYLPEIKKYYHENELSAEEMERYNQRYKAVRDIKPIILRKILGKK